jgi:preprotein translocase subunit SecA
MGVQEGEVIEHPMVTASIGRAQKRVEAHNFDIRKHLLEYDNVMNQQRTVIYGLRDKMLLNTDMSEEVLDAIEDAVRERVAKTTGGQATHRDEWNVKTLADELSYLLMRPVSPADLESANEYEALEELAVEKGVEAYKAREQEFTVDTIRELERHLYLYTLDEHWRDHLYELDHLKGGIGLRAYGQKDPLIEYKKEAFKLFETLVHEVNEEFVQRLFRVQLMRETLQEMERRPQPRRMVAQHESVTGFGGVAPAAAPDGGGEPAPAPAAASAPRPAPMRAGPRVGRNDPCPCGSGKMYKKCHMPIDEGVESGT